jgi:hypothetical protein
LATLAALGGVGYKLAIEGKLTVDVGLGRTVRPLGPITTDIAAPREIVFDVIARPYLDRTPRAMADELEVIERGSDMVLAAHRTPVGHGLVSTTLETVRFLRPDRIDFRLVRGPVPYVAEQFVLLDSDRGTKLDYAGELGADFWQAGRWWAEQVAPKWEATVRSSLERIGLESERRASKRR